VLRAKSGGEAQRDKHEAEPLATKNLTFVGQDDPDIA